MDTVRGHLSQPTLPIRTTEPNATIPAYVPPHKHNPYLVCGPNVHYIPIVLLTPI